ncbi:GntR family transcriptional regulator [Alkalicoccus halolimnae]|uniref:GntR family transcriptional regulator n=1 Tax=Alkalicoccus halolimnae TaxID=1667239 RepID=A0A5C7F189_9BACI|nr:GntR family transcriptional regulator [Alkalicoccus halolimnae]TXF83324.1 GntR family transcriptional regulator [Alkalicoccus halolimnae]
MKFPVDRMNTSSKGEEIAALLRYEIISGQIKPGDTISENSVASLYNASRSPSREALKILKSEGLLELKRLGAEIVGMSLEDIEELNDIRFLVEGFAMKECAKKQTASLVASLNFIVEKMRIAIEEKDFVELAFQDIAFHEAIIKASEHKRILHLWNSIDKVIITALLIATEKRLATEENFEEFLIQKHLNIIHSIKKGIPDEIESDLQEHFLDTRASVNRSVFTNNKVIKEE